MSWFLTTQLLEIALKEASKGEDKSKISMDDIQKLADVLQRTEEEVFQSNAESPELHKKTVASEVNDTKNDILFVDEKDETIVGEEKAQEKNTDTDITYKQAEVLDSTAVIITKNESEDLSLQEEPTSPLEAEKVETVDSLVESSKVVDEEVATEEPGVEYHEKKEIDPGIDAKEKKSDVEVMKESMNESETAEATEIEVDTLGAEEKETDKVSLRPHAARIPDVISRAYGRSLEVISSAVPPLRDSSIPKGSADTLSIKASKKNENETPGEVESITAVETLSSANATISLENSPRLPSGKSESEVEIAAKYSTLELEDRAFEVLKDLGMVEIHDSSPHTSIPMAEQPNCIESVGIANIEDVDDKEESMLAEEIASTEDSSTKKVQSIAAKKPVHNASKQPAKQNLSQAELAAKYAEMTLEDRAFEILKDLGMIEIHEFSPTKLSTVQQEQGGSACVEKYVHRTEETKDKIVSATHKVSTDSVKKETFSKRHRFFRPIRRVFERSKEKLLGSITPSSTTPSAATSSLSEAVRRARQQPKSPFEEALLAEKYGQMSIEDRAYAILCDLGMIESV